MNPFLERNRSVIGRMSQRLSLGLMFLLPFSIQAGTITVKPSAQLLLGESKTIHATSIVGEPGSFISGSGMLDAEVTVEGTLDPTGIMTTGALSIESTGHLNVALNGTSTPGTNYDQIQVARSLSIHPSAMLMITGSGGSIDSGNRVTLIQNDGDDVIAGHFSGLSEGSVLSLPTSGSTAFISYLGATGIGNNLELNFDDNDGDLLADTIDPDDDNDGLADIAEIAFGLNPQASDLIPLQVANSTTFTNGTPLIQWDIASSDLKLTAYFVRLKDDSNEGYTYLVEISEDLVSWNGVNTLITPVADGGGDYEVVKAVGWVGSEASLSPHFARITVRR